MWTRHHHALRHAETNKHICARRVRGSSHQFHFSRAQSPSHVAASDPYGQPEPEPPPKSC